MSAKKRVKKLSSTTPTIGVANPTSFIPSDTLRAPPPIIPKPFGIEELRGAYNLLNNCNETFNHKFTVEQLINIYRAYKRSEFDVPPDRWTEQEIIYALAGFGTGAEYER